MRTIRILACLAAACAVSAVAAAQAAAAPAFDAETFPVKVEGPSTNIQGFGGSLKGSKGETDFVTTCKKATLSTEEEGIGNPTKASPTLEVHPKFSECKLTVLGASSGAAESVSIGCNYVFHAVTPGELTGTMDIKCSGKPLLSEVTEQSKIVKVSVKIVPVGGELPFVSNRSIVIFESSSRECVSSASPFSIIIPYSIICRGNDVLIPS